MPDRTLLCVGHPEAIRIAVDLPQDFCGAASLALRFPDSITALDNEAGNPHPRSASALFLVSQPMRTSFASRAGKMRIVLVATLDQPSDKSRFQDIKRPLLATGVCPNGGSSVVTWTRVCGRAGNALIPISAVEIVGSGDADSHCAATL